MQSTSRLIVYRLLLIVLTIFLIKGCATTDAQTREQSKANNDCLIGNEFYLVGYKAYLAHSKLLCENEALISQGLPPKPLSIEWPKALLGKSWNKRLAFAAYQNNEITVVQLGQLYAALELVYRKKIQDAEYRLANSLVSKPIYKMLIKDAKANWKG